MHVQYDSESPGFFRARLRHCGLLVIFEEDSDCSVWLLDTDGRTNGPIWDGALSESTSLVAATESKRAVDATPAGASFNAWPPVCRDLELEELVNGAWRRVQEQIDATQVRSADPSKVKTAIDSVWRFIDRLTESGRNGSLVQFREPFKLRAADLIRAKFPF